MFSATLRRLSSGRILLPVNRDLSKKGQPDHFEAGTYFSDDGGRSWTLINNGMVLDTDMFEITFDPENPDNMWVATCGWVYNTKNSGDNWTRFRDGFNNRRVHDVELDPCDRDALFEAVHGSAPDNAGQGIANPTALMLSAIQMLRYIGEREAADHFEKALFAVFEDGVHITKDLGGTARTNEFARAIEEKIIAGSSAAA